MSMPDDPMFWGVGEGGVSTVGGGSWQALMLQTKKTTKGNKRIRDIV
jgi:hypothetical protein